MEQGIMRHALCKKGIANDPVNDQINGPISGPVTLTERQELILQMFAEYKCLSIGRLCEKTGLPVTTAICETAFLKK